MFSRLLNIILLFYSFSACAQSSVFKEGNKWGIKENDKLIIPAVYDTVFNFDRNANVCLACVKTKQVPANRFVKSNAVSYNCFYLNRKAERLVLKNESYDTLGVFSLTKNAVPQYQNDPDFFIASVKDKKFLVKKDFTQITKRDYNEISAAEGTAFFLVEQKTEGNQILKGLIDINENSIVPVLYSNVKINMRDSLLVGCSAGLGQGREDDVYDFSGKKLAGYKRHIDIATKKFIVHKIWEPKEYYIIYNIETKEEQVVYSEEVKLHTNEELLMRNENHWFTYELKTGKKKAYETKNIKKH